MGESSAEAVSGDVGQRCNSLLLGRVLVRLSVVGLMKEALGTPLYL